MAKSDIDVRTRLQRAAVELFAEQGFDRTTAAGIAARVGVTERTFFRHFPDKREVLFDGQAVLIDALTASIADAPVGLSPLATLFRAFRAVVPLLEGNRSFAAPRHAVIAKTAALRERELAKLAALADALARALRGREVSGRRAALAAQVGTAAFVQATVAWLEEEGGPALPARFDRAERELRGLL